MTIAEIQQEILRMKKEQDICILAHAYQGQEILEVADEKTPDNASNHEVELIKDKEGERILKNIRRHPKETAAV